MVRIDVLEEDKIIKLIQIKGHANYKSYGNDIVCASISSIATTTINAILRLDNEAIYYEASDGDMEIKNIKNDHITNELLINMVNLLEELAKDYKKNIQVKRGK